MTPLERLGLGPDADERAIKRAYAQRLRTVRPDEDPEGFQLLHAAYRAALEQCREPASVAARLPVAAPAARDVQLEAPAPPSVSRPMQATAPAFDGADFYASLLARAEAGDAAALQRWLQARPELWSLPLKARVGREVLQALFHHPAPMPATCLAEILRFFDLDHALSGIDPLPLQHLERRMQLAWSADPQAFERSVLRLHGPLGNDYTLEQIGQALRQLARPLRYRQAVPVGVWPRTVRRMNRFIASLCGPHIEDLPAGIARGQVRFWLDAADPTRASRPRLAIGLARSVAAIALAGLVGLIVAPLLAWRPNGGELPMSYDAAVSLMLLALFFAGLWGLWMAWLPLERWYADPAPARHPWLRRALIPVMCAAGLGLHRASYVPIGMVLLLASMLLATRRLIRNHLRTARSWSRAATARLLMLAPAIALAWAGIAHQAPSAAWWFNGGGFAVLALGLWLADLALAWRKYRPDGERRRPRRRLG